MLRIIIKGEELFNETDNTFSSTEDVVFDLEHSLISLSKWESKYEKPFLSSEKKTSEEILEYIKTMVITPDPDLDVQRYIDSKQSATTFGAMPERRGPGETITSELIYYWIVFFNIPFDCQYWHLNRLFSLIKICNIKSSKPKKLSRNEMAQRNRELNAKWKAELGTRG